MGDMRDDSPMLLLCSNGPVALKAIPGILGTPVQDIRLLYVFTAAKVARDRTYLGPVEACLQEMPYQLRRFDIQGKTEQDIDAALAACDAVYVEGGNPFFLLQAVRDSGFAQAVQRFLAQGKLYAGASAGAYIACPTIAMATWRKPGDEKPQHGVTEYTAMHLVPFLVVAHYTPKRADDVRNGMQHTTLPVRLLQDGQGLLVNDDGSVEFFGEGEEGRLE